MRYAFIYEHQDEFDIKAMCHVLEVSRSGYYKWRQRRPGQRVQSNQDLVERIRAIHQASRGTYGSPRIHAELREQGICCSRKRVARLMQQQGIRAKQRRHYKITTRANPRHPVAENLLQRDFSAERPNQKWVVDITYINTFEGWLYLAVVLDVFSRKVVGWSMSDRIKTRLVEDALKMALARREPEPDLLHHSDRGSQYTSHSYQDLLRDHQIGVSMSGTGNAYDNAMVESFFATLKTECADYRFRTRAEARLVIFEYIEVWYNRQRRHSALGFLSPQQRELFHSDHSRVYQNGSSPLPVTTVTLSPLETKNRRTAMNSSIITIGLDLGYGFTKAAASSGRQVCFESRVAPAEFIRFQVDIGARVPANGLTLHDTSEGALWVGELAAKQGRPGAVRSPRDRDRVADPIVTHLADAAFALLLPGVERARLRVVTGLPVAYYRDAFQLSQRLLGTHRILLDGRSLTVEVEDVLVVPQPFGALLSLILDERGRMMAGALELVDGRVGVLDIGTHTTDLILVEGLEYIEARSSSIEVGVSTALDMIRKVLLDDYRVSYENHELEQAMRRGWLIIEGHRRSLDGLASDRLDPVARSIEAQARTLWNISTLTALVLAGGGALALSPWLEPRFEQAIYAPNAALANAVGFLRYGLRQWRE